MHIMSVVCAGGGVYVSVVYVHMCAGGVYMSVVICAHVWAETKECQCLSSLSP